MRQILIYLLKNFDFVLAIYNIFFRLKNKSIYKKEVVRRAKLSIFEIEELSNDIPYYPIEKIRDSNYYGYLYWMKKYAQISKDDLSIEHGLYLTSTPTVAQKLRTTKRIITMSPFRKDSLSLTLPKKNVYSVGPYIYYAESYLTKEEIKCYKKKYGKILLVVPSHSTINCKVGYDIEDFIDYINSIKKNYGFDTVIVSAFYLDIKGENSFLNRYKKEGYLLATAGHRFDVNFVRRLKTMFEIADYMVSNAIGTHTGFATFMNVPQSLFKCKTEWTNSCTVEEELTNVQMIESVFSENVRFTITDEQHKVIDKFWGISCIKTQEELKVILA